MPGAPEVPGASKVPGGHLAEGVEALGDGGGVHQVARADLGDGERNRVR